MTVIVGFCAARANTGKTTLILRVLEELERQGITAAVLKHGRHLDKDSGKDSSRYAARTDALFVSPEGWVLESRPRQELPLERAVELICGVSGCQVLLIEGYKKAPLPKIALCRQAVSLELPCPASELAAVVSDLPLEVGVPCFGYDDIGPLCDLILSMEPGNDPGMDHGMEPGKD